MKQLSTQVPNRNNSGAGKQLKGHEFALISGRQRWTEELGMLQSMRLQRVRHDLEQK